ncbi:lactoylglutathione lyase [Apiospora sp. TS-2023a]
MATTTDTKNYKFNHSMLRVKDPKASVKFYEFLGMSLIKKLEFPDNKFDLYFLAYDSPGALSSGNSTFDRRTTTAPRMTTTTRSTTATREPHRGFGHICISVDNIQSACNRIEQAGYKFQKKLTDGRMKHIAFALDPDGYWVEIVSLKAGTKGADDPNEPSDPSATDVKTYRMNHTMIRVKDAEKSLKFYQETMGMTLLRTVEQESAGFNLYFLGYPGTKGVPEGGFTADYEGLLELTWNYGTEKDESFKYHDGNSQPQGFGHICVSVDHLDSACERLENMKVSWKKRLTDGRMKNVAFVLDPDGYWIEIVQNERFADKPNF